LKITSPSNSNIIKKSNTRTSAGWLVAYKKKGLPKNKFLGKPLFIHQKLLTGIEPVTSALPMRRSTD
jgi:hypothetical protein